MNGSEVQQISVWKCIWKSVVQLKAGFLPHPCQNAHFPPQTWVPCVSPLPDPNSFALIVRNAGKAFTWKEL